MDKGRYTYTHERQVRILRFQDEVTDSQQDKNTTSMLNFLIFDFTNLVLAMSNNFLLFKDEVVVTECQRMREQVSSIIETNDNVYEKSRDYFLDLESDLFFYVKTIHKIDILDFLKKEWLRCLNEMILINMTGDSTENGCNVRFNAWQEYVYKFLKRLKDKHIQASLNALFLHIDIPELDIMMNSLKNDLNRDTVLFNIRLQSQTEQGLLQGGWLDNTINRISVTQKDLKDPLYFNRVDDETNKYKPLLRLQTSRIVWSFEAAEMVSGDSFHTNDGGRIKKCISTNVNPEDILQSCRVAHRVDLWLNLILTTMQIQLSQLLCAKVEKSEKKIATVPWPAPSTVELHKFFEQVERYFASKWCFGQGLSINGIYAIGQFQKLCDLKKSEYSKAQKEKFMRLLGEYQDIIKSDFDSNALQHTQNPADEQSEDLHQYFLTKYQRNNAIFRFDLHYILSEFMEKYIYPLLEDNEKHLDIIRRTFNAAINNEPVSEFMSEKYIFLTSEKYNPVGNNEPQKVAHKHMDYITNICKAWYRLPESTFNGRQENEHGIIDFQNIYTSRVVNPQLHQN